MGPNFAHNDSYCSQIYLQPDRQTDGETYRQIDGQTDRRTDRARDGLTKVLTKGQTGR